MGRGEGPALSAPDSWPPALIWRSPAGVPGRAPYLHVRVHACAVSLLCDNKNLVTTCPRSQIVSPVPVPLGWRFRPPSSRCVAGRGVGCWVLRDPARAGCSCWHRGSWSQFVVPICAAPAEIGVSLPSPCPHSLLVPSPGLLCLGLRPHPVPALLHPCHHHYPTELSTVGTPLTPQGPPVPSSSHHRCPQCPRAAPGRGRALPTRPCEENGEKLSAGPGGTG